MFSIDSWIHRFPFESSWALPMEVHKDTMDDSSNERESNQYFWTAVREIQRHSSYWQVLVALLRTMQELMDIQGPDIVLVGSKDSVQNVLIHEDLVKAPPVAEMRLHRTIPSLLTDKPPIDTP